MRRILLYSLVLLVVLCSCRTTKYDGGIDYLQSLGEEGEFVITIDTESFDMKSLMGDDGSAVSYLSEHLTRVSFALRDPSGQYDEYPADLSKYDFYGAAEGDMSRSLVNTALSVSGQFISDKNQYGLKYYRDTVSGLELAVPEKGVILFSSSDVSENYSDYYLDREPLISDENVQKLKSAPIGIFISQPKTLIDLGVNIQKESLENISYILITLDDEYISMEFRMKDEKLAGSFSILIRAGYVASLKKEGKKADISQLKNVFTQNNETVSINGLELTEEQKKLIEDITDSLIGIF